MRNGQKMTHRSSKNDEIVSLTLTLFSTPLNGFSPFSWWPLIFQFSCGFSIFRHHHLQVIVNCIEIYSNNEHQQGKSTSSHCWKGAICEPLICHIFTYLLSFGSWVWVILSFHVRGCWDASMRKIWASRWTDFFRPWGKHMCRLSYEMHVSLIKVNLPSHVL